MILIIGLGNPGKEFEHTPHNLGFAILNSFQEQNSFSDWQEKKKMLSLLSEGEMAGQEIVLAKPQTFMNKSGKAVKALLNFYKLKPKDLWVVHDDLDLDLGEMKISQAKGSAGHKGVQSIIDETKTNDFVRFRLGVSLFEEIKDLEKFVLKRFSEEEQESAEEIIGRVVVALEVSINSGLEQAMNDFN